MLRPEDFTHFSTYLIAEEAQKRGIKVTKFFLEGPLARKSTMQLEYKKHKEIIVGQRTSQTDVIAYWIQQNKQLAKKLFAENGISVAKSKVLIIKIQKISSTSVIRLVILLSLNHFVAFKEKAFFSVLILTRRYCEF